MKGRMIFKLCTLALLLLFVVESQAALVDPGKAKRRKARARQMFSTPAGGAPKTMAPGAATNKAATDTATTPAMKKKY